MNIYESITAIMQEGYAIGKENRNEQQKFMYRGIDDVMNTFQPLLSKYKVFVVPEVIGREREERSGRNGGNLIYSILTIRYTFYAEDGSSVSAVVVGEGMDSGDKASNKAMAVGMKYAMFQTFCIPTEEMRDDDPDKTTTEPTTPKKAEKQPAPKEPEKFVCADCGEVITPWVANDGKTIMSVREIAQNSEKAYKRRLCLECARKAKKQAEYENAELHRKRHDHRL